jgi:hypothetical protein
MGQSVEVQERIELEESERPGILDRPAEEGRVTVPSESRIHEPPSKTNRPSGKSVTR